MRYYSDLLPSYLDGENIRRHSSVIEESDKYVDALIELFGVWSKLERPIIIKREQNSYNGVNTVTLYVNTPTPITEIIIDGDIEETITPNDSVTTSYENTWTITNPSIDIYTAPPLGVRRVRMPLLTVTVRTETHTYTKTYPENDTIQNNDADHDIFLDIVGGLLGIPRRQYSTTNIGNNVTGKFAATVPPYMAKEVQTSTTGITSLPCSEDDYYYYERLNLFINSQEDPLRLFHTIYDPQAIILQKEDGIIPAELVGTDSTVLFTHIQKGRILTMNSLNIDTTNIQQIAEQSLPITRPVQIYPYATIIKYSNAQEEYVNKYKLQLTLGLNAKTIDQQSASFEVPIANLPVNITYEDGTEVGTWTTDENGTAHISIDGARGGQQTLKWDLTREYPYFDVTSSRSLSYDASLFKLSLSDGAWQYKKLADTTVTGFEPASMLSNNNLNCGAGMIAYTPAINPQLVDLTNYNIHIVFHHTNNGQQIRIGTLQETEETAQLMNVLTVRPRQYETGNQPITATHTIDFKFIDGVCHAYFDGTDTGLSKDYSNITDMIYLGGYNSTSNSETRGMHFEEIVVTEEII